MVVVPDVGFQDDFAFRVIDDADVDFEGQRIVNVRVIRRGEYHLPIVFHVHRQCAAHDFTVFRINSVVRVLNGRHVFDPILKVRWAIRRDCQNDIVPFCRSGNGSVNRAVFIVQDVSLNDDLAFRVIDDADVNLE